MATYTEHLNLIKPDQIDQYDVDDFNGNADILDNSIKILDDVASHITFEIWQSTKTYAQNKCVSRIISNKLKLYQSKVNGNIGKTPETEPNYWEEIQFSGGSNGTLRSIGEVIFSPALLYDETLHRADGSILSGTDIPEDFMAYITQLKTDAPQSFVTETEWQRQNNLYGECGKYVYVEGSNSIRLPKLNGYVKGTINASDLGSIQEAGLPSLAHGHGFHGNTITGSFGYAEDADHGATHGAFSGAFSYDANTYATAAGGIGDKGYKVNFSATPSGSITSATGYNSLFGKTTNSVEVQAIQGYYYICITNLGSKSSYADFLDGEIDRIDGLATQLEETIESLGNIYTLKGFIASSQYLPSSDNTVGDVYITLDTKNEYLWVGVNETFPTGWKLSGSTEVDLSGYYTKQEIDTLLADYNTSAEVTTAIANALTNYYTKLEVDNKIDSELSNYYNMGEINNLLLQIETGDIDISSQLDSAFDNKYVFSTGLNKAEQYVTNVSVITNDEGLTVTSSYTGSQSQSGTLVYVFTYNGTNWINENEEVVDLSTYYLSVSGTPTENDTITLTYTTYKRTTITTVFDGDYDNLTNKPTIPDAQIQANWAESDNTKVDYIKNKPSLSTVATSGSYDDLTNKPTIPTVPTALSSFTDDLGTSPTHTHSQYLTSHQDISGKEDVNKAMNTLATSGTIALTDNSVNKVTPTGNITFTLPTVTDLTVFHQILVQINLSTVYTFDLGLGATPHYFNKIAPDLSNAGVYNLVFEYDNANSYWVAGVIEKGASS